MLQKSLDYFRVPKKLFWILFTLIFIFLIFYYTRPSPLIVDSDTVKKTLFQSYLVDEGTSHYKERRILTAPADGVTPTLSLDEGEDVKKNQILFYFIWDKNIPIVSPFNGVILKVFEKDQRSVPRGTPLLEIGDPNSLEIKAAILSEQIIGVKIGQKAIITKWGGPQELSAKVTRIDPAAHEEISALGVKEQRVHIYLELTSDRKIWRQLGDGFRLEVKIIKDEKPNATLVPIGSLFRKDDQTVLYLIDEKSKARLIAVDVIDRNQEYAEIKNPLPEGQKVIIYPSSKIKDGSSVKERQ